MNKKISFNKNLMIYKIFCFKKMLKLNKFNMKMVKKKNQFLDYLKFLKK